MANARIILSLSFFFVGGGGGGIEVSAKSDTVLPNAKYVFWTVCKKYSMYLVLGEKCSFFKVFFMLDFFVKSRFFTGGTTKNQESQKSARWRSLHARGTRWPYRVTASDDHWQLPRGDNENLTTRASCFARCTESVYEGFVHPRTFLVPCRSVANPIYVLNEKEPNRTPRTWVGMNTQNRVQIIIFTFGLHQFVLTIQKKYSHYPLLVIEGIDQN